MENLRRKMPCHLLMGLYVGPILILFVDHFIRIGLAISFLPSFSILSWCLLWTRVPLFFCFFFSFYLSGHIDARMEIKRPRRDHTSSDLFLNHGRGLWPIFKLFNSVVCQQTWLPLLVTKRTKRYISLKCFQKEIFQKKPSKLNQ